MLPTNDQFRTDYTPEELSALLAEHKKKFTADDLFGYIEDDEPTIPLETVIAEAEEVVRQEKAKREGKP